MDFFRGVCVRKSYDIYGGCLHVLVQFVFAQGSLCVYFGGIHTFLLK
jgi:hypothetical protein